MTKYLEQLQGYQVDYYEPLYQANEMDDDQYLLDDDNEVEEDKITIVNPTQPYTFKDGQYMVIGSPMNNQIPMTHED